MDKWEVKTIEVGFDLKALDKLVAEYLNDSWEVVSISGLSSPNWHMRYFYCTFKRKIN